MFFGYYAVIIGNDTTNHSWVTLQEIGKASLLILFATHWIQTQRLLKDAESPFPGLQHFAVLHGCTQHSEMPQLYMLLRTLGLR